VQVEPEVEHETHKIGHKWIDLALSLSALFLSITSIVISISNDRDMQRLVTANSWPYLELGHGNAGEDGGPTIHFNIKNAGIGPAMIEKFVLSYDGQRVSNADELLRRCCGLGDSKVPWHYSSDLITGRVLPARESILFLQVPRQDANAALWDKLQIERMKIGMAVCYSSVFGEHWITGLSRRAPRRVQSCKELDGTGYDEMLFSHLPDAEAALSARPAGS
jgi:hypothetical protein